MKVVRTPDERFADLADWPYEPRYVEVADDLRMHYVDEGPADGPVVLCVHGEPTWGYLYRKMIPGLVRAGMRVVVPDLVGFGRSDKPTDIADYSYQAHLDWYCDFVDALALDGILLFGQDWGGQIGIVDAVRRPERHRGVVAANTGVLPGIDVGLPDDHPFWRWCRYAEQLDPFRASQVVGAPDSPLNPTGHTLSAAEARAYDAPFPDDDHCAAARAFPPLNVLREDQPGADICRDAWERLARFDAPFLVVLAEHEESFDALAPLFEATVPGALGRPTVTIPGAGHYLQEHAPDTLVDLVVGLDAAQR